jgi:SPP1 gp7 family putative phage head morphogenesis protein
MTTTINERFLDFQVAQQIRWLRFSNEEGKQIQRMLARSDSELARQLAKTNGPYTKARIEAVRLQLTSIINDTHDRIAKSSKKAVSNVIKTAAKVEVGAFKRFLPAGLDVTTPNLGILATQALNRPYNGAPLSEWMGQLRKSDLNRTWRTVLDGLVSGTTTDDLIRQVVGTKGLRYKDGVREATRRGAQAYVRTAITNAANEGRQGVWENNEDLIKGVRWVATLDTKTSPICRDRDGQMGPVTDSPSWSPPAGVARLSPPLARPPAHPNCRSTTVAVTKSWRELGIDMDELDEGTRAAMDGSVPSSMNYYDWLNRQPTSIQKEVLGKGRYDMWKDGNIKPDAFVDDRGHTLTLAQLRNLDKDPIVLRDAGFAFEHEGISFNYMPLDHMIIDKKNLDLPSSYQAARDIDEQSRQELVDMITEGDLVRGEAKQLVIQLKKLETMQSTVRAPSPDWNPSVMLPEVFDFNGRLILKDGNHRIAAAIARGDKTMKVSVVTWEARKRVASVDTFVGKLDKADGPGGLFSWSRQVTPKLLSETLDAKEFGLDDWSQILKADYEPAEWTFVQGKLGEVLRKGKDRGMDHPIVLHELNLLRGRLELNTKIRPQMKFMNSSKFPEDATRSRRSMAQASDQVLEARANLPNWMLEDIGYDNKNHPGIHVTPGVRAFARTDGGIVVAPNSGYSVVIHEMFHEIDHALAATYEGGSPLMWKHTQDKVTQRFAEKAHAEFLARDQKGFGKYANGDGKYALGDWRKDYEGRLYPQDEKYGVGSEYLTMNAQYYVEARSKGIAAFTYERNVMRKKSPRMLDLLDHIFEKGGWAKTVEYEPDLTKGRGLPVSGLRPENWNGSPTALGDDIREFLNVGGIKAVVRLDPTEFGLEKWPVDLDTIDQMSWNRLKSDMYYVIVNTIMEGGTPKRYATQVRKYMEKLYRDGMISYS